MSDSVFTKIINGEIPCHKIYEDELTFAFLDIHPVQPGHCLIVPKQQIEFLWDLPNDTYQAVTVAAQKVARHLREVLGVPYVGEQVIGVDVPHAHIHLIPFTTIDDYRQRPDMQAEPDHEALAEMAKKLALF